MGNVSTSTQTTIPAVVPSQAQRTKEWPEAKASFQAPAVRHTKESPKAQAPVVFQMPKMAAKTSFEIPLGAGEGAKSGVTDELRRAALAAVTEAARKAGPPKMPPRVKEDRAWLRTDDL